MIHSFKTVVKEESQETLNQGSKFIAYAKQVSNVEQARAFILELRQKHPFASHVCYAYSVIDSLNKAIRARSSDDREPSGTAGKPILELIRSSGFNNIVICVVRYFGGTLLGASNLLRAYVTASQKVLENAKVAVKDYVAKIELIINYNEVTKVEKFLEENDVKIIDTEYFEDVVMTVGIKVEKKDETLESLNNLLKRTLEICEKGKEFF